MLILGTAGHIDHGKTTLVRALTGIDTDRLKEEKERGISIVLGFAWLDLPNGTRCGIVDVPGHERFVRQMISGAQGIDLVALIIAADEGVMPQTREHFDILRLLNIRKGFIVITKTDLVEPEHLELVREEVADFVKGSFLEGSDILMFSSVNAETHEEFKRQFAGAIMCLFPEMPQRPLDRPYKLSIDRVFNMKGFGAVVTGTTSSGVLHVGDEVEIVPQGLTGIVRGIEVHGENRDFASAGMRTAANIQGVNWSEIRRGGVLTLKGQIRGTQAFDCSLTLLSHMPDAIKNRSKVLVHIGTTHVLGTVRFFDREMLEPSEECFCKILLEQPVAALSGDPFILRGFAQLKNYGHTIGGGIILNPYDAALHDRETFISAMSRIKEGSVEEAVLGLVELSGSQPMSEKDIFLSSTVPLNRVSEIVEKLSNEGKTFRITGAPPHSYVSAKSFTSLCERLKSGVSSYHEKYTDRDGVSIEELKSFIKVRIPEVLYEFVVKSLVANGEVVEKEGLLRMPDFAPEIDVRSESVAGRIGAFLAEARLTPPSIAEISEMTGLSESIVLRTLDYLTKKGACEKTRDGLYFDAACISRLEEKLAAFLKEKGEITPGEFKDLAGVSRKFAIPLLEHFDLKKVTLRIGNKRILRKQIGR